MMPLYELCDKHEERLADIFRNIPLESVRQVMECHGDEDNDCDWVFLIWTALDVDDDEMQKMLQANYDSELGYVHVHKLAPNLFCWQESVF